MITVEKAMKDGKARQASTDDNDAKRKSRKKLLIVAGVIVAGYFAYRAFNKTKNEGIQSTN